MVIGVQQSENLGEASNILNNPRMSTEVDYCFILIINLAKMVSSAERKIKVFPHETF